MIYVTTYSIIRISDKARYLKYRKEVYMNPMNMSETARLILGLRAAGWTELDINNFILFIETGEDKYKPSNMKEE